MAGLDTTELVKLVARARRKLNEKAEPLRLQLHQRDELRKLSRSVTPEMEASMPALRSRR